MKTAMQLHIENLIKIRQFVSDKNLDPDLNESITETINGCIENAESFLEKEKQQIIDAHMKGQLWNKSGYNPNECQKYYTETFNNND